jgi:3-hydroxybutyryl-CoA dehydrogenase
LPQTLAFVKQLCTDIGKTAIEIKDFTGFAVNRLLHVFMIEAVRLVEEGVATPQDIDIACRLGLGHPMGPFELMDATTSSLWLEAQQIMHDAYGGGFVRGRCSSSACVPVWSEAPVVRGGVPSHNLAPKSLD